MAAAPCPVFTLQATIFSQALCLGAVAVVRGLLPGAKYIFSFVVVYILLLSLFTRMTKYVSWIRRSYRVIRPEAIF